LVYPQQKTVDHNVFLSVKNCSCTTVNTTKKSLQGIADYHKIPIRLRVGLFFQYFFRDQFNNSVGNFLGPTLFHKGIDCIQPRPYSEENPSAKIILLFSVHLAPSASVEYYVFNFKITICLTVSFFFLYSLPH